MTAQIQVRRDQKENWESNNPRLRSGEFGFEENTGYYKIGDGSTQWNSLLYAHAGAYQDYDPTLSQNSATVARTKNYARYYQVGKLVSGQVKLTADDPGTGAAPILVSLPVNAATSGLVVGSGFFYDADGSQQQGVAYLNTVSAVALYPADVTSSTAISIQLEASDIIVVSFQYEAA